jgi:hypothetical protein
MRHKLRGGIVHHIPDEFDGRLDLSRHQRKKMRRAMRGVCLWCNQPAEEGRMHCTQHRERVNELARVRYQRRTAEHMARYGMTAHAVRRLEALGPRVQGRRLI